MVASWAILMALLTGQAQAIVIYDILIQGPQTYSIHLGLGHDPFTVLEIKKIIQNHEKIDFSRQRMFRSGSTQEMADSEIISSKDPNGNRSLVVKVD
ncbi:MAG TPA: hypothetical protein VNJ29_00565 [Candidatus Nitrosotenuis sp.]|jgi:hypothetical protein|nr:hypothetical protein [Candidatus Nitrosotenuis sp.]